MRGALISLFVLMGVAKVCAQHIGVGYYDLDGAYDTTPSLFYDDSAYTPSGRYEWSEERYRRKIDHSAAVIDSMKLPIFGLYGVENESVVRGLVAACSQDYTYIHRTRNSFDGLDFSLLYFGDKLFVDRVVPQRNMLIIYATLADDDAPITIILSRDGDETREYLDQHPVDERVVVMGNLYQNEISKLGFINVLQERESRGEGNCLLPSGWDMHDRIAVRKSDKILKSGVYITPWLLDPATQLPLPTFNKHSYIGGYSKFLPIFAYILL